MSHKPTIRITVVAATFIVFCIEIIRAAETKRPDVVIADFETETYGAWKVEGEAFGPGPALGALPGQMPVAGFQGKRLVNSFFRGDGTVGKLTSTEFTIERPWLNFLIGGGGHDGETCVNLLVDGKVERTETGTNTAPGGSEELQAASWDVASLVGKKALLEIVDHHTGGWGHINVDQIVLSDTNTSSPRIMLSKKLLANSTHLIVPVSNAGPQKLWGIYAEGKLIQSFTVALPAKAEPSWLAAYPIDPLGVSGKEITLAPVDRATRFAESHREGFDRIKIGTTADALSTDDYQQPYRDQFHVTTRRGWNNDPNGMVYHDGKFHMYYQHNPFGIGWGNMHWGHFTSKDLIHWEESPIALYQKTVKDMAFSGGGFVDVDNTAGLGANTLFVAFTSTGRGECLAFSKDGGRSFNEIKENPVVKHNGRDPKIIWYKPERKWVMAIFDDSPCAETEATPAKNSPPDRVHSNIAFWESKNLKEWRRTGAFSDPDRMAVFECPELFELKVEGAPQESRWILYSAQNRYFVGQFDGKTFVKESGPHGESRGALYAAQTFSNVPDGRRIQIGWIRNTPFSQRFRDQIVSQSFTLPHELTLRNTEEGLRVAYNPVKECEQLREKLLGDGVGSLDRCGNNTTEVVIEFETSGRKELTINGVNASFNGRRARIYTDRTFNEIYVDGGLGYVANQRDPANFEATNSQIKSGDVKSLQIFQLRSIWK